MSKYNKHNTNELRNFLFICGAHDSRIANIEYNYGDDKMTVHLDNPYNKTKISLTFIGVDLVLSIKGKEYGRCDDVNSLTLEEDYKYLYSYLANRFFISFISEESLYLLFQMFSGTELHIISKEIITQIVPTT